MTSRILLCLLFVLPTVSSYTDESINLLARSSSQDTVRRYCVDLAKLPNGHTVNISGFGWHRPYLASPSVNACNITDLQTSLPPSFVRNTLLVLYEHGCKMTEHAWNVEHEYGDDIALMVISNRSNIHYDLTYNTTTMPVSIPVLVFWQKDLDRLNRSYGGNFSSVQLSIGYPVYLPKKFRPAVLLMFLLVLLILLGGNAWAADEFKRKVRHGHGHVQSDSSSTNTSPVSISTHDTVNHGTPDRTGSSNNAESRPIKTENDHLPTNGEPAIIYMPYCIIALILCFAIGWLLLIFYFPKVMIYVLQVMFCIGALSSLTSCLDRLSYFLPIVRRYRLPARTLRKPCVWQVGPLNVYTLCALALSLATVIVWYIFRQADWGWVLQDILGAAICISVISVYRLGNMRVITLILLGFFFYDIFFVFITPYIPFFQPSKSNSSAVITTTTTTTTTTARPILAPPGGSSVVYTIGSYKRVARNPSVMEQVALGFGTGGEVVPLLFALPMFIPESEIDPCLTVRKSMLGFGDVILPGILLTFCKIFDAAHNHRWPIYYVQSVVAYFFGLSMTHVALYLMDTAQPALLYLVPCILLSTIITGLCRGELRELYTGRRITLLLENQYRDPASPLLADSEPSAGDLTNQSVDVAVANASDVENR